MARPQIDVIGVESRPEFAEAICKAIPESTTLLAVHVNGGTKRERDIVEHLLFQASASPEGIDTGLFIPGDDEPSMEPGYELLHGVGYGVSVVQRLRAEGRYVDVRFTGNTTAEYHAWTDPSLVAQTVLHRGIRDRAPLLILRAMKTSALVTHSNTALARSDSLNRQIHAIAGSPGAFKYARGSMTSIVPSHTYFGMPSLHARGYLATYNGLQADDTQEYLQALRASCFTTIGHAAESRIVDQSLLVDLMSINFEDWLSKQRKEQPDVEHNFPNKAYVRRVVYSMGMDQVGKILAEVDKCHSTGPNTTLETVYTMLTNHYNNQHQALQQCSEQP